MKRVDSLLSPLIKELGITEGVTLAKIKRDWHTLFGMPLPYHMSPLWFSNGEVLLQVDSPVWLQELNCRKEELIKKLCSYGVKTVRFKLGRVVARTTSKAFHQRENIKKLTTDDHMYIEETVSQIENQELRAAIRKAIEKSLTVQKRAV